MNTLPISTPSVSDELCVQLRDLMEPLSYSDIANLRARFDTFKSKLLKNRELEIPVLFKADIYVDYYSGRVVDTYVMTRMCAVNFACWVDPAKGMEVMSRLMSSRPEPITPVLRKTVNKRILAERYGRNISSITRTFERNREWIKEIGGSELHIEERDGDIWFTEQYAACIAFGGGKKAVLVKAAAMVASTDNPQLESGNVEPILKLVK